MPKVCPVCGTTYSDSNAFCPADGTTLRSADVDGDLIGTVVADRYLVTDLLGEGGMGRVYLARHVRLPQQAAIKVLRPALLRDPASVARFNREASNASRIEHERVARVFDFGETSDGTVYIAMEYVQGRTLKKLLTDEAPLAPLRAAALVKQVADGLDAAHRMGIVHRDLKPDNILVVTEDATGDRAKVVDFGIAKAIGGDSNEAGLTQTGFVVGTPEFMAPEQMLGGLIDARTDMYALALVAFQCLTNSLPFDTTTPDRGLTARMTEAPRRLDFVASNVTWPLELQAVFDKALLRDLELRYPTAGAFADALTQAVHAWVGVSGPQSSQSSQSYTASAAAAASASAVLPASNVQSKQQGAVNRPAAASSGTPATPSGGSNKMLFIGGGAAVAIAAVVGVVMMINSNSAGAPDAAPLNGDSAAISTPVTTANPPGAPSNGLDTNARISGAPNPPVAPAGAATNPANNGASGNAGTTPPAGARGSTGGTQPPATSGAPVTSANPLSTAPTSGEGSRSSTPAGRSLDSLRALLPDANAAQARAMAGQIQRLLPRLGTLSDSVWAYIGLAEANLTAGEEAAACTPLRNAKRLAVSPAQIKAVTNFYEATTCAP